jgi:hypothetical protein
MIAITYAPDIGIPGLKNKSVVFTAKPTYSTRTLAEGIGGVAVIAPFTPRKYEDPGLSAVYPETIPAA